MSDETEDFTIPRDALAEIFTIEPQLSDKEAAFVYWRAMAVPPLEAYKRAGYSGGGWRTVETRPIIREVLITLQEQLEPKFRITREKVIGLLMEGIELARRKEQPKAMIEGALALAGVAGVGAAQKIQVDQRTQVIPGVSQRPPPKALPQLGKGGLEELVGVRRILPTRRPALIEAEVVEESHTAEGPPDRAVAEG